ncbi:MAG: glucosaminidase domain-containing protein [Bryobacterales bacterium]|nr:glucosaminidase domain-containing protein [Bryobacterales bacterium]
MASMLALPGLFLLCSAQAGAPALRHFPRVDPRAAQLRGFFDRHQSPAARLAATFLRAADQHRLDWRLLPSIAFVESSGGKAYRANNILGWGNGEIGFHSIENGIHTVAERLANSSYYRGKSVEGKLRTYNPTPGYSERVMAVMKQFGPVR